MTRVPMGADSESYGAPAFAQMVERYPNLVPQGVSVG